MSATILQSIAECGLQNTTLSSGTITVKALSFSPTLDRFCRVKATQKLCLLLHRSV